MTTLTRFNETKDHWDMVVPLVQKGLSERAPGLLKESHDLNGAIRTANAALPGYKDGDVTSILSHVEDIQDFIVDNAATLL